MYGLNFTDRTRAVLARARDEAVGLDHEYVGTEHILLALLADRGGVVEGVFRALDADPAAVRADVERVAQRGTPSSTGPTPTCPTLDRARAATLRLLGEPRSPAQESA